MSLQVWLPLNGDLHNQGLSNAIVTSEGTIIIDSNGKIGKCYKFGTAKGRLIFPVSVMKNFTNACSIAFWIKINTWNTNYATIFQCGLGGTAWTAYRFGILRNNNNKLHLAISDGTNSYYSLATNDLTLGQWYHICFTYTTGKCSCYVNGTFLRSGNTTVVPGFNGATVATIGAINASGGYQCDMYLNDFRIYDHCLSQKEVKEISKGLILHYKLNNSINYSANLLTTTKSSNPKNYNAYQINMNPNFTAEEPYTLQLGGIDISHTGKTADTLRVSVYWGGGYIPLCDWTGTDYIVSGKADYLKTTFIPHNTHANSANSWINIYNSPPSASGTMNLTIKDWRLTAGNSVPFISDVSGYNNNGDIMGDISFTTNTPRYDNSITFNNTAGKIRPQNFNSACLTDSYTFAWWQYNTSTGNMAWGFSDGNRVNLYQTTTMSWNTGDGNTNQFKTSNNSTLSAATYQNKWTHFCITGDGTTTKLYINGIYTASAITYKPITGNNLWISGWDASTSYTFNGSKLSDFRIYTTPLSAEDILELYNTSATIDNQKNIYARELVEIE